MKKIIYFLVSITLFGILYSCSVTKNSAVNRNFHAITTKYNVLFNGKQAYLKGLEDIKTKHTDNFWKRLEIEPISFDDSKMQKLNLKSSDYEEDEEEQNLTKFDKAESKARKAIETHSMNIDGYEKNRQIDDAYLLLGKARYYTQRFIPAIDAFNYIIANYPKANLIYDTKIWRAKANIRLENEKFAIESLKLLVALDENEKNLTKLQREQAHTALAMAYEKTDTIQKVIKHLHLASQTFKNKEQSARNLFVLGQIYNELQRKDSAAIVFRKLANTKKAPHKYRIRASIELAKNTENDSTALGVLYKIRKLIKNSDNRKFLAALYFQAGVLEERRGATEKAKEFYKKSLRAKHNNDNQKTYAYENLGAIAFKEEEYLLAKSYYDSVLQTVPKEFVNDKRIRRLKRKNTGLTTLKKYEDIVKVNDSVLQLVAMTKEERTSFFTKHIEKLKKQAEEQRQLLLNSQNFGNAFSTGGLTIRTGKVGKWYFYNNQVKNFGMAAFTKTWGNRPLEDNWRISDKNTANNSNTVAATKKTKINPLYELATYLDAIPTGDKEIQGLKEERNDAFYQLGLIYKEQFKNNAKAIANLERLLASNAKQELELPINYHLCQLYIKEKKNEKAAVAKALILSKYANTPFASILKNPKVKIKKTEKQGEDYKKYRDMYYLYKSNRYEDVVTEIDKYTPSNSNLIPKFTLLKALAIGRFKDKKAYKDALDFVALNYPNTQEGKKAKQIRKQLE